ncbi:alkaline phosphatase [Microvirga puerhi]|uniref:Alkaline phosphatase n=1 Tax=Microvirga puerhi TaxID=2876078 RepID=A0ABS7VH63_9HYPH|nr:alkaline phosphatase [Microvirga puerhi]MBZ6074840.1 alkaline phosphatase [Microvirga puerhi]
MKYGWLAILAVVAVPGVAHAQAIYPIDRATILSGSKFDFKVELPKVVAQKDVKVTINGEDAEKVLGAPLTYVEKEDGADASSLIIRNAAIGAAGDYVIEVKAGDLSKKVKWAVYGTPAQKQVKNVIFLLGDGLSVAHRTGARIMSKGNTEGKANGRLAMDDLPAMAFIGTSSTDAIASDSANTMSAYMTGHKSAVNALGVYASRAKNTLEHPKQETIAEIIRRNTKMSIGVVSGSELQDATPAAVVGHTRRRADKAELMADFFNVKPEVLLGGGSAYFLPKATAGSKRKDDIDYVAKFKEAGYAVATTEEEMTKAALESNTGKLLGLFHPGNMDVTLDRKFLKKGTVGKFPNQPGTVEMMQSALNVLSRNPEGFFLMVEGASIDKMSHPLDWERALVDTIEFDKAVAAAQDFAKSHPDTLIIVTGDHTHGVSIIGTIDDNKPGEEMREKVGTYAEAGFPNYTDSDGDGYPDRVDVSRRLAMFANNFPDYYETFRPKLDDPFVPAVQNEKKQYVANEAYKSVPGAVLRVGNLPKDADTGVHAVDDVVLQAQGPGSEKFHGYMENTDVFRVMAEALALGNGPSVQKAQK